MSVQSIYLAQEKIIDSEDKGQGSPYLLRFTVYGLHHCYLDHFFQDVEDEGIFRGLL